MALARSTSLTANFTDADTTTAAVATSLKATSLSYTHNLNYRFNLPDKWCLEPTIGFSYTLTTFDMDGLPPAEVWVVH